GPVGRRALRFHWWVPLSASGPLSGGTPHLTKRRLPPYSTPTETETVPGSPTPHQGPRRTLNAPQAICSTRYNSRAPSHERCERDLVQPRSRRICPRYPLG